MSESPERRPVVGGVEGVSGACRGRRLARVWAEADGTGAAGWLRAGGSGRRARGGDPDAARLMAPRAVRGALLLWALALCCLSGAGRPWR